MLVIRFGKMNKEEVLKAFPNYEEITEEQYYQDDCDEHIAICLGGTETLSIYLKPKQTFPIVFEDDYFEFKVYENNLIIMKLKANGSLIFIEESLPLLEQAIEKSKEIRKELKK
jgi:hypothetical protein